MTDRRRSLRRLGYLALTCSIGLGLALGLGAPKPGVAERSYAGAMGLIGWYAGLRLLLQRTERTERTGGDLSTGEAEPLWSPPSAGSLAQAGSLTQAEPLLEGVDDDTIAHDPALAARANLEMCLRLGRVTSGEFRALVHPRLVALATARLARHDVAFPSPLARELLGPSATLVDPDISPHEDRTGPGTPLQAVEELVGRLERLG